MRGLQSDPQLPFFVQWESPPELHPSTGDSTVELVGVEIAGSPRRVATWLDTPPEHRLGHFDVSWVAPNGTPGIVAVTFRTPDGSVRI